MTDHVQVKAARIPDRDKLLAALRDEGLEAEPHDELEITVPVGDGGAAVFHQVETLVISVGAPFVPIEHEGVIYIRPPVG
ncbi:MAG TPA: hypothetical protein VGH79_00570 [Gaiellaceae bacterium]|jgi:hypothetical protein